MPEYKFGTMNGKRVVSTDGGQTVEEVQFGTDPSGKRVFKTSSGLIDFVPEGVGEIAAPPRPKGPSGVGDLETAGFGSAFQQTPAGPGLDSPVLPVGSEEYAISNLTRGVKSPEERADIVAKYRRDVQNAGKSRLASALSSLGMGTTAFARIPSALQELPSNVGGYIAEKAVGKEGAQIVQDVLRTAMEQTSNTRWVDAFANSMFPRMEGRGAAEKGTLAADKLMQKYERESVPMQIVDPATGQSFSNIGGIAADPDFWMSTGLREAPPMLAQLAIIKASGGSAAPAFVGSLGKSKALQFATKLLQSPAVKATIGLEAMRVYEAQGRENTKYLMDKFGYNEDQAKRVGAASTLLDAGAQGMLGALDVPMLEKLVHTPAGGVWGRIGRGLGGAIKEGFEEFTQSLASGAVQKATIKPELTGIEIARQAAVEGLAGMGIGGATGAAVSGRNQLPPPTITQQQIEQAAIPTEAQPVAPAKIQEPVAPRPIEQIRAEMQPVMDEITLLEKRLKPTKPGSKKNTEYSFQLEEAKARLDALTQEADLINREMIPQLGATGELNLSPEDVAMLQQQLPTNLRQQVDPRLAAIEQQGEADRMRARQLMEAQNALEVGSATEVGQLPSGQEGVGVQEGGRVQQGVQGEGLAAQGQAAQEEVTPYSIPQQTIDRAVSIRNSARIAQSDVGSIPEGVRAGVEMRSREAKGLVDNYNALVEQLASEANMPGARGKQANEQLAVARKRMESGLKRIQRDIDSALKPHLAGVQEAIQIKLGNQTHTVTDPADIQEIQATRDSVAAEIEAIKNQPMTSAERASAIKEVGAKVEQVKQDVVNFPNTRKAIRKHAKGGYASAGGFLEVGAAIVQDLMAMGTDSFQKFVQTVRAKLAPQDVIRLLQNHGGFMNFYNESRQYLARNQARTQTVTGEANGQAGSIQGRDGGPQQGVGYAGRGESGVAARDSVAEKPAGYGVSRGMPQGQRNIRQIPEVAGVLQSSNGDGLRSFLGNFDESLGQKLQESGNYWRLGYIEDALQDPNAQHYEFYANDGSKGYAVFNDRNGEKHAGVVIEQEGHAPIFFDLQDSGKVATVDWMTNGGNYGKPGSSSLMYRHIGDIARQMGAEKISGYYINGAAASLPLVHDGAQLVDYDSNFARVEVPVDSVANGMRDSEQVRSLIKQRMEQGRNGKLDQQSIDDTKAAIEELRGKSNITYLSAGLNPLAAIDAVLNQIGRETLGQKLGIDWNTATTQDYIDAITKLIGKLGKTAHETAIKIHQKLRDVGITTRQALKMAEWLHQNQPEKIERDAEKMLADVNGQFEPAVKQDHSVVYRNAFNAVNRILSRPTTIAMRVPAFRAFNHQLSKFVNKIHQINNLGTDMNAAIKKMKNPQEKSNLALVLAVGTLANNGEGVRYNNEQLKKMGFSPEGIKAYNETLDLTSLLQERLRNSAQRALDKIDTSEGETKESKEIKKLIDSLHNQAYWPLQRFGNYKLVVRDNDGKVIGVDLIDAPDNDSIHESMKKMAHQSPEFREAYTKNEYTIDEGRPVLMPNLSELIQGGQLAFDSAMADYLLAGKQVDEKVANQIKEAAGKSYIKQSLGEHLKHRSGIAGYSLDLDRIADSITNIYSKKIARLDHGQDIADAHAAFGQKAMGKDYNPDLDELANIYKRATMNPGAASTAVDWGLKGGYLMGLVGTISSGLVNGTQAFTIGLPVLGNFYGYSNTAGPITKALVAAARMVKFSRLGTLGDLDSHERRARIKGVINQMYGKNSDKALELIGMLMDAAQGGELQPKFTESLFSQDREKIAGKVKQTSDKVLDFLGYTMSKPEEINRVTMMLAAADLALEKGVPTTTEEGGWEIKPITLAEQLSQWASEVNDITNFTKGRGKKSRMEIYLDESKGAQWLKLPLQFTAYPIQAAMSAHNVGMMNAARASSNGGKIAGYSKPLVAQAVAATLIGGPAASMFGYLMSEVLRKFSPEDWDKLFGTDATDTMQKAFEAMGLTKEDARMMAIRVKQGGAPGLIAGISLKGALQPQMGGGQGNVFETLGEKMAGIWGTALVKSGQAATMAYNGDYEGAAKEATKALTPRFIKGFMEGGKGEVSFGGTPEKLTNYESLLRMAGFQSTRIVEMRDKQTRQIEPIMAKQEFLKQLKRKAKTDQDASDALDLMDKWNEKQTDPKLMFDAKDKRSVANAPIYGLRSLDEIRE